MGSTPAFWAHSTLPPQPISPRPSSNFSECLVLRLALKCVCGGVWRVCLWVGGMQECSVGGTSEQPMQTQPTALHFLQECIHWQHHSVDNSHNHRNVDSVSTIASPPMWGRMACGHTQYQTLFRYPTKCHSINPHSLRNVNSGSLSVAKGQWPDKVLYPWPGS